MPTRRAMWETPAGAIGQQTRWSERWKNYTLGKDNKTLVKSDQGYGAMFEWKDNQRRLFKNREADDPDIANIELFRPDHQEGSLDYKSRSFSLGSNITDSEFDELFPDREPTEVEKKLKEYKAQIDALTAQLQVINEDPEELPREVRRPGNAQPRCAYTAVSLVASVSTLPFRGLTIVDFRHITRTSNGFYLLHVYRHDQQPGKYYVRCCDWR